MIVIRHRQSHVWCPERRTASPEEVAAASGRPFKHNQRGASRWLIESHLVKGSSQ